MRMGLQLLQGVSMRQTLRLFIVFISTFILMSAQELILPDTIIFKPGSTPPGGIRGTEIRCAVVFESETSVKIDRSTSKGISDMIEIPREIIAEIKRADVGERRFQELKLTIKLPENSQEASYYTQILEEELEPFLSKYSSSQYVPDVQKMIEQVKGELDKVYLGHVRRGDRWMMSQEWKDLQKEYEPLDLFRQIESLSSEQDINAILELTKKLTTDHPSIHYPGVVEKTYQLLTEMMNGMTADIFVNKVKDQLVGVEGKLDTQNALLLQEKDKAERRAIQGRIRTLTTQKTQLTTQINQIQKNYSDLEKKVATEIDRLRKIDMTKKVEAVKVLQGAEKLKGNSDAVDAFVAELQKAAKLWPGCTGVWSLALTEASFWVDAAATALQENRLGDAEVNLKKASGIFSAAGSLPQGVGALKKLVSDNLRVFASARTLSDVVHEKQWDKVPDRLALTQKALVPPKPLDYPVMHRFAKAFEEWVKGQEKIMTDTMAESDSFVAKFYEEVKSAGFIAASENLLKAKELWNSNPKIAAANVEFKGELERVEREKRIAKFKPHADAVYEALKARNLKEAELAIKKLESAFTTHPDLDKMKFELKDIKDKNLAEEKARQEAAEKARLEEERKEKQKQLIIYSVISLIVLIGATVGFLIWRKKKKQEEQEVVYDGGDDSPPTVS